MVQNVYILPWGLHLWSKPNSATKDTRGNERETKSASVKLKFTWREFCCIGLCSFSIYVSQTGVVHIDVTVDKCTTQQSECLDQHFSSLMCFHNHLRICSKCMFSLSEFHCMKGGIMYVKGIPRSCKYTWLYFKQQDSTLFCREKKKFLVQENYLNQTVQWRKPESLSWS